MITIDDSASDDDDDMNFDVDVVIEHAETIQDSIKDSLIGRARSIEDLRHISNYAWHNAKVISDKYMKNSKIQKEEESIILLMVQVGAAQIQMWAANKAKDWEDLG